MKKRRRLETGGLFPARQRRPLCLRIRDNFAIWTSRLAWRPQTADEVSRQNHQANVRSVDRYRAAR